MKAKNTKNNRYLIVGAILVLLLVIVIVNQGKIKGLMGFAKLRDTQEIVSAVEPITSSAPTKKLTTNKNWALVNDTSAPQINDFAYEDKWNLISLIPYQFGEKISYLGNGVGYLLSEQTLYKTTDNGRTWVPRLTTDRNNLEYFTGFTAQSDGVVLVSGYSNSADKPKGIVWTSTDGGVIWQPQNQITTTWLKDILVGDFNQAVILGFEDGSGSAPIFFSSKGGLGQWRQLPPTNGQIGWFGTQSSFVGNRVDASGISNCTSWNGGAGWSCRGSIDPVFDGVVKYLDNNFGFVAGGTIYPEVKGWIHRTTDGGATWTGRLVNTPWPIRSVLPINQQLIYADGGNASFLGENRGGIIVSIDGGLTWQNSLSFPGEFRDCSLVPDPKAGRTIVQCVGTNVENGMYVTKVYELIR